eukprot:4882391-Pyramimonas_sp.AAC.1
MASPATDAASPMILVWHWRRRGGERWQVPPRAPTELMYSLHSGWRTTCFGMGRSPDGIGGLPARLTTSGA